MSQIRRSSQDFGRKSSLNLLTVGRQDSASFFRKISLNISKTSGIVDAIEGTLFQLRIIITDNENNLVTFKHDGGRFEKSEITLKLLTNNNYRIMFKTKPTINFETLELSGSKINLRKIDDNPGDYCVRWSTNGIDPTPEGSRDEVELILKGKDISLRSKLQVKFYGEQDDHAKWGQKAGTFIWHCCQVKGQHEAVIFDDQII